MGSFSRKVNGNTITFSGNIFSEPEGLLQVDEPHGVSEDPVVVIDISQKSPETLLTPNHPAQSQLELEKEKIEPEEKFLTEKKKKQEKCIFNAGKDHFDKGQTFTQSPSNMKETTENLTEICQNTPKISSLSIKKKNGKITQTSRDIQRDVLSDQKCCT